MGNKILGRRSRSFYRGFNEQQLFYIHEKFQTLSLKNNLSKKMFMQIYKLNEILCDRLFQELDFDENNEIDQYQFTCMIHSLCSMTITQLGQLIFKICTKGKNQLNQKQLLNFTFTCCEYNNYILKKKQSLNQINHINRCKFQKYDYDKNLSLSKDEFIQICLKDQHYKLWMYNMGFITLKQMQFQDQFYDLVDSDIADEIDRHTKIVNENQNKLKKGMELPEDQFQVLETIGEQSSIPLPKPWLKTIKNYEIQIQNMNAPSQTLTVDYVYGYRSFDCRNNVKFDTKGRIIYHQAAIGIVLNEKTGKNNPQRWQQNYIIEHHDDISCLDIIDDLVVTGQVGNKPMILLWQTNLINGVLQPMQIITQQLTNSVANVCLSKNKELLAASCNDQNHHLVIYNLVKLKQLQNSLTSTENGIIAHGQLTKNIIFQLKFMPNQKSLVVATLKQIIFVSFDKGILNSNRGIFNDFSISASLSLLGIKMNYKSTEHQFMLSGMGNGSIYFWQDEKCTKSTYGHKGSISALCLRKDINSFISGDKTGYIIIWNQKIEKQKMIQIPKTNGISSMIVALNCNQYKQMLIGTKSSDIFILKIGDSFDRAENIINGHNYGHLWALTVHKKQPFFYTGGEDQRLIKWQYKTQKTRKIEKKCPYPIKSLDFNLNRKMLAVGFLNGIIDFYDCDTLDLKNISFRKIKNPDQQTLNKVKFDRNGNICIGCYSYPSYKIIILSIEENNIKLLSQIKIEGKILALDYARESNFIRFNTDKQDYLIYDISDLAKPISAKGDLRNIIWATHTLILSPQTQGFLTDGTKQNEVVCCDRSHKYKNVFVLGDKYSKLKLFNYPCKQNHIFNKYQGHSNQVTGVQFCPDQDYFISIGGEQKSIILWKYNADQVNNQFFISNLEPDSDYQDKVDAERMKKTKVKDQFDVEEEEGEQALAVKAFLGQIKSPSNFNEYNPRKDNQKPKEQIKIRHVFGLRNKYLKDEVRNQCKFTNDYKNVVFPTACMAVKMNIQTRHQEIYLQHKQDIVSFAIDRKRQIMATGQMAEKNFYNPRKKILSIYIWNINDCTVLKKMDDFHTIAIVLLEFSPSGKLLFSCGNDQKNSFAVWDWKAGALLYSGPVSRAKVNGICWKNEIEFMTCGNDHVKFWTNNKGKQGKINGKSQGMFTCLSSKNIYITGSGDGNLYNWIGNTSSVKIKAHIGKVQALQQYNNSVYSGGDDGKILKWLREKNGQISNSEIVFDTRAAFIEIIKSVPMKQEEFGILSIDFSPRNEMLVGTKGASLIHSYQNKHNVFHQGHYKGQLWALSVRKGQQIVVTGGDDGTVRLWDLQQKKQIRRVYFEHKIRGLDCATNTEGKIVVADSRARLYLFNKNLSQKICQYTGQPYEFNQKQKLDPWVEDIKFSPDCSSVVYGTHAKSLYLEYVQVNGRKLEQPKSFKGGSSALLHVDWSRDSSMISINTQAYELLFYDRNGNMISASSCADENWATWTRKFGFPVQGIFQGVDYSDINTVCRDPTGGILSVGYDDQTIRLFKNPCYIPKQVCKTYYGHSSHITRIKFTSRSMISIGGLDRTLIVWDVLNRQMEKKNLESDQESDGLGDLDEDIDLPLKAITRKSKPTKVQQFFEVQDQGDEFMAIKPWLGAIKQPTYDYPEQSKHAPHSTLNLQYVFGYRCKDCRQNLYYSDNEHIIYHAAAVVIFHNLHQNTQQLMNVHSDDILSIDYNKKFNIVVTGQLGPKPLMCWFKDGKLQSKIKAPVNKGILALAIERNAQLVVCAGMDEDHYLALISLRQQCKIVCRQKGGKKVIVKLGWVNSSEFISIGIKHYKYWSYDGSKLSSKEGRTRDNLVSLAISDGIILTGGSKGSLINWNRNEKIKQHILKGKNQSNCSVIECINIQDNFVAIGNKNGYIFILNRSNLALINQFEMANVFLQSDVKSELTAIRAIDFIQNKMLVGTLGAEIYEVQCGNLNQEKSIFKGCRNIMKCHYSPNNSWTNQVWGLHIYNDFIFTCSDDATLRCWSLTNHKLLCCASLNYGPQPEKAPLEKDKRTHDYSEAAKGRSVSVSLDGKQVIVGCKNGTVRVYDFDQLKYSLRYVSMFRHAKQWISDIKFAYNTLIIGSHDDRIYVYNYQNGRIKMKYRPMKKHSSYITHMDVSRDSCFLQSTCGAYQLLFWDLNAGKQITAGATMLRDQRWKTWTCNLGWPVQGIYPKCTDGTFINAVDRSNFSINQTLSQDDSRSPYLLAVGNDDGKVCLFNYPCIIKSSNYVIGVGHSSHVTTVRWSQDDKYVISTGGQDQCLMLWRVHKNH